MSKIFHLENFILGNKILQILPKDFLKIPSQKRFL
jgi:hypothetical protein